MRGFRLIALMAVVAVVPLPEPAAQWQLRPWKPPTVIRQITARVVGEPYTTPWYSVGSRYPRLLPPPLPTGDPHERGRAFLRRGEVPQAIPVLREAARNGDPAALTDLAAALLGQEDHLWRHSGRYTRTRAERSSLQAAALEAIALLNRAIRQRPGLAAAHFNLGHALRKVGLTVEARKEFEEAIRLSDDLAWNEETTEHHAGSLSLSDPLIDQESIQAYVEVTSLPGARRLLQPYLAAQERRLRRARLPDYSDSRFLLAADSYVHSAGKFVAQGMETFCPRATAEPCAMRYLTAGALYATGRKAEAATWLVSVEDDIERAHGGAGLRALQRWEEGANMVVRGQSSRALDLFEAQYAEHRASGERTLAAMFDGLRRRTRIELVSDALARRDTETAFRYADDSSLRDVQGALAPDAAILRYATVQYHHKVVFVVRRDSVDVVTLHDAANRRPEDRVGFVSRGADVGLIGSKRGAAEIAWTATRMRFAADPVSASLLYELVIAPVLEKLHGVSTIAVIPNADLAEVPFGALFDTERGEYLAERFTIVHAPSARAAVELSKRARGSRDSTLLAIGATEFDRARGDALAGVGREIAEIAAQSPCARVLSGEQATPDAIQRALGENTVVHYGGHIVRRGADLRLLLASSRGRDSLSAEEIAALRLDKARVVVLAGCRGAASGDPHAFIRTVADAFLAAGVPTVIATSYDVDDAEAPPTMRLLHAFLSNGDDAAEALRKTTLAELRAGRGLPLAVRFQAVGGTSGLVRRGPELAQGKRVLRSVYLVSDVDESPDGDHY